MYGSGEPLAGAQTIKAGMFSLSVLFDHDGLSMKIALAKQMITTETINNGDVAYP